jgi:hypothetical protein
LPITLQQYFATPTTALPILVNGQYVDAPFANQQTLQADGPFGDGLYGAVIGNAEIVPSGAWLRNQAALTPLSTSGPYIQGSRYYVEEGLVFLGAGMLDAHLGYHNPIVAAVPNLRVYLNRNGAGQYSNMQLIMGNVFTGSSTTYTMTASGGQLFDRLPWSISGSPEWSYYWLERINDGATNTQARCYFRSKNGSGYSNLINVTPHQIPTGGSTQLGGGSVLPAGDVPWRIAWFRAAGSDVDSTPIVASGPWTDAVVFTQAVGQSDPAIASSYFDAAGPAGPPSGPTYWNLPFLWQVDELFGSMVEGRFYATDTIPTGNIESMFSGQWHRLRNLTPAFLPGGGLLGRYLFVQLRVTPSPSVALGGASAVITEQANGDVMGAAYRAQLWESAQPPAVTVTLEAERASENTLPIVPDYSAEESQQFAVVSHEMAYPYRVTCSLATRGRRRWRVHWDAITLAQVTTLEGFFAGLRGGEGTFTFSLPGGGTANAHLATERVERRFVAPNVFEMAADFEEIFA